MSCFPLPQWQHVAKSSQSISLILPQHDIWQYVIDFFPSNMRRWTNIGLMVGRRRRRWPTIKLIFVQRLAFPWLSSLLLYSPTLFVTQNVGRVLAQHQRCWSGNVPALSQPVLLALSDDQADTGLDINGQTFWTSTQIWSDQNISRLS